MLKKSSLRRIMVATLALFILLIIYFFPTTSEFKETLSYIEKEEIPIFLVDSMEYIARTSIVKESETTEELIEEVIDSLTIGSEKSNYIRDGFKGIIPKNTKVLDTTLEGIILTINFSKEFLNVSESDEEKMLEALTYSLLEIPEIKKISILVEGEKLKNLPNSKKKLPEFLDRNFGINKIYNLDSIKDTSKTTIYRPVEEENKTSINYITAEDFEERIKKLDIGDDMKNIKEELKKLQKQIKEIKLDMSDKED